MGRLVGWLRDRFTRTGDEAGSQALAWAEGAPGQPVPGEGVGRRGGSAGGGGPGVQGQVQRLVEDAKQQQGMQVESITQSASGNQNVQTAGNQDTSVTVSYGSAAAGAAS